MSDRFRNLLPIVGVGLLLLSSCSKPTPPEAAPVAVSEAPKSAVEIEQAPEPPVAKAPVAKASAPKPQPPKVPAAAPVPSPTASAPVPVPVPVPTPSVSAPVPVASAPAPVPVVVAAPIPVPLPTPPAPTTRDISIPSGTLFALRMIDAVDSKTDKLGQTFKASLDSPVFTDGQTVIPKGADVFVKLVKVQSAGSLSGTSELQLQLDRVFVGNKSYTVTSNVYQTVGDSQGKKAVKQTAIGAGVGAVIGAIAGGKKGAAIGAGVGGGAGATVTAIEKGEQVRVESETKLTFRLELPLNITVPVDPVAGAAGHSNNR